MYRRIIICLAVCISFTTLNSFASEPNDYIIPGRALLFNGTLSGVRSAYQIFDNGLKDGNCAGCQTSRKLKFFHASSRTAMLLVRDDGNSINSAFEMLQKFGVSVLGQYWAPYFRPSTLDFNEVRNQHNVYQIPDDAPDINDIRDSLDASFIPEIEEIISELNSISDSPGNRFRIYLSPDEIRIFFSSDYEFQGPLEPLEVDFGEVLLFKGLLTDLKAQLEMKNAYDTYVEPNSRLFEKLYGGSLRINEDILSPHPQILKVLPTIHDSNNGAAILAQAAEDLISSLNYYLDMIEYIRSEEDWQGDDFIYIDPNDDYVTNQIESRLTTLRDSRINDTVAKMPIETTKTYSIEDPCSALPWTLMLSYDIAGYPLGGSFVALDGNKPGPWEVSDFEITEDSLYVEMDCDAPGCWGGALFTSTLSQDGNTITNGTFEYWGSSSGTLNNLSGQIVDIKVEDANIDLNPIFGSSGRYPNPVNLRDLLPMFDQWNAALPGTVGHGLDDDPTLGGIVPQMTQYDWQKGFGLQPSGLVYLDYVKSSKITINGNISDWDANQLIFNDISGDTGEDSNEISGVDIKNLYLAYDWDNLYGAIEFYDDIKSAGHYYYTLFLSYSPYERDVWHSLKINVNVSGGSVYGYLYYMDTDDYGYTGWQYISSFTSALGQKSVEFKIPFDDISPDYIPGRFITVESEGWNPGWSESDGEKNSTHLKIGEVGTISGTVSYNSFQGDPIFVQAYTNPQDPEESAVATVMITSPGPYTLEGIGLGWEGYVRAFTPLFGFDNLFESGAFQVQTSTPVWMMFDDLDDVDITLTYPLELEKGEWKTGEIDSETREVDWYYIDAVQGKTYMINLMRGTAQYACIALYDRNAEDELIRLDYGQTQLISWTCPVSGRYYVEVADGFLPAGGTYQIRTSGGIIYVDTNASGLNNGTSWPNAYKYLQDALAATLNDDEIWVAQGTYRPDENTGNPGGTNNRDATFGLKNYLAVYGGFASGGGTWDSRDPNTYETILSGDLGQNDGPNFVNNGENSYHVVTGSNTNSSAVLNGFTVTAGNANTTNPRDRGAGMFNSNGSPTVTNCTFVGNSARSEGGGMYNSNGSPTLINCTFTSNSAVQGSGMRNSSSSPTLINCTFTGNSAVYGGGMRNYLGNPTLFNCTFTGNSASRYGGGIFNNTSNPTVTNCTFVANSALAAGGGVSDNNSSGSTVVNCILWNNTAPIGAQIYNDVTSSPSVSYCDVQGGWAGTGNIIADPCFIGGGNYRLLSGSPCIDAGDNNSVPPDTADFDGDGNTTEPMPIDLDGFGRFADDLNTADTGNGIPPIVDMGTYEFGSKPLCRYAIIGDLDDDCRVEFCDLRIMAENWLGSGPMADIEPPSGDGRVNVRDFAALAENWLIDCRLTPGNPACVPK